MTNECGHYDCGYAPTGGCSGGNEPQDGISKPNQEIHTDNLEYPEHEKILRKRNELDTLIDFLERIQEGDITYRGSRIYFAILCCGPNDEDDFLGSVDIQIENLVGQWAGVDQNKLEQEKREMLARCREVY